MTTLLRALATILTSPLHESYIDNLNEKQSQDCLLAFVVHYHQAQLLNPIQKMTPHLLLAFSKP